MSAKVLSNKDVNAAMTQPQEAAAKPDVKSLEYHRQMLQSKMEDAKAQQYISPSDNITSPCTAKLNAFRNKQVGKAKPKSLFAQASTKKLEGEGLFGARSSSTAASKE